MGLNLQVPISGIKGIPPRFAKSLGKLKIFTIKDLLWHFPARYEDFSEVVPIANLEPGQQVTVNGIVEDIKMRRSFRRRLVVIEALIRDDSGTVKAVWFNQPYLVNTLRPGRTANFSGKVSAGENEIYLSHPSYELTARTHADYTQTNADAARRDTDNGQYESVSGPYKSESVHTGRLVPVYPETRGLTSRGIRFLVQPILKSVEEIPEWIPEEILENFGFPEINDALREIHFPESEDEALAAKKRFSFEELFLLQLMNIRQKLKLAKEKAPAIKTDAEELKKITEALPFKLTVSQKQSLWEIAQDIGKQTPMNRLLQGDVGSGKTVVAAVAAFLAAENDLQSAFMAPTEILARQHFQTLKKIFSGLPAEKQPEIALLVSKEAKIFYEDDLESSVSKEELKKKIESGAVKVIVGTHALIQKDIAFENLGLVIVDEQHRFGVSQRKALVAQTKADLTQTNTDGDLLYEELTYKLRGIAFKLRKELGLGHKEAIYQKAFEKELKNSGLSFEKEKTIDVKYGNEKIGTYRPDFIIEDKIILELKALPSIGKFEKNQIWHYLKTTNYRLALLVNFSRNDVEILRVIHGYESGQRKSVNSPNKSVLLPHLLSMSATPIPRTLMLTIFGDLDISIITELPAGRKPILTKIVAPTNRGKAYAFIRGQIRKGRQAFVICPRIDKSQTDTDDARTDAEKSQQRSVSSPYQSVLPWETKAVKEEFEKLSKEIFPDLRVGMLHGQMKSKEKEKIMADFKNNKVDILVSTSVIEVGVDVPNATIMMIEGADRFGLAQLYQFRGRVGRGEHQSFCFLFTDSGSAAVNQRLKAIVEAKNGFELAEMDLKMRGPGEFIGQKQTGLPDNAMTAMQNFELIKTSREAAAEVLEKDKALKNYPLLAERLAEFEKGIHLE